MTKQNKKPHDPHSLANEVLYGYFIPFALVVLAIILRLIIKSLTQ